MSRAIKCDRCGKYYEAKIDNYYVKNTYPVNSIKVCNDSGFDLGTYDLCRDCMRDLYDFLTGVQLVTKVTMKKEG